MRMGWREGAKTDLRAIGLGLAAMAMLTLVTPAPAQSDARACTAIEDDAQRLACFDAAFAAPVAPGETPSVTFLSEQLIPGRPSGRLPAEMVVACADGVLQVRFSFANQLMSATGDFAPITFQIDQQTARSRTLNAAPDNMALGFWTTGEANQFLNSLDGGQNLAVRVTPVSQRSLSVRFNLAGFDQAVAPIRQACQ